MKSVPEEERTEDQNLFLHYYNERMPVGMNDCVMNRICRRFEREFDGYVSKASAFSSFDRSILKSGAEYTAAQMRAIKGSYEEFRQYVRRFRADSATERIDEAWRDSAYHAILVLFEKECRIACSDEKALCDLIATTPALNLRYKRETEEYLEQHLRLDMEKFYKMRLSFFQEYATIGRKANCVQQIINLFK